ncbi:MAG TPA: acetyl-CoA C-acyltransferase FadI [Thermoanaerobaculia bacterium]|nr:acetyl-CoA C-acyltransferase FadI [Thermoanaerobaculia bacterium]
MSPDHHDVAIVAGLRTPFAKRMTELRSLAAHELGALVASELLERQDLDPAEVERVVFGRVVPALDVHNPAREVVLRTGLPASVEAHTVSKACITGYQTVVDLLLAIRDGGLGCGLAAGADSASQVPVGVNDAMRDALLGAARAEGSLDKLKAFREVRPADLVPHAPDLTEPTTGETMGEGAERMAKTNSISRQDQDAFAHRSHVRAAAAWKQGRFDGQVMPLYAPPDYEQMLERDNLVREDSELERYAELPPVFDREHGTVTAGNSSPLTDGAAAVLLMASERARALGHEPLGFLRAWAFTAVDPAGQLLIGPAYAIPAVLDRAGLELDAIDLVDLHEAFSSAVLSVLDALASDRFAREQLGRSRAVGEIDPDRLNVDGGSIALGHPFAATGIRQIVQTLTELRRRGGGLGLCAACAAGGMGAAAIVEAA